MNTLTVEQQQRILTLLEEGKSLREVERITGHRRETISLYGRLAGVLPRKTAGSQLALAA
jgi:transcriptional regulator